MNTSTGIILLVALVLGILTSVIRSRPEKEQSTEKLEEGSSNETNTPSSETRAIPPTASKIPRVLLYSLITVVVLMFLFGAGVTGYGKVHDYLLLRDIGFTEWTQWEECGNDTEFCRVAIDSRKRNEYVWKSNGKVQCFAATTPFVDVKVQRRDGSWDEWMPISESYRSPFILTRIFKIDPNVIIREDDELVLYLVRKNEDILPSCEDGPTKTLWRMQQDG